jgi:Ca2+-binding EF-hand superfamily protein
MEALVRETGGTITADELQSMLRKKAVYIPATITNLICQDICASASKTSMVVNNSISTGDFVSYVTTIEPFQTVESLRRITSRTMSSWGFRLNIVLLIAVSLQIGNDVVWLAASISVKGIVYRIQSTLVTIGSFGFFFLLFDHCANDFDMLERTRLKFKTDLISRIGKDGEMLEGWAKRAIASVDNDNSGTLDLEELERLFNHLHLLTSEQNLATIFKEADTTHSKGDKRPVISLAELEQYLTKLTPATVQERTTHILSACARDIKFPTFLCFIGGGVAHMIRAWAIGCVRASGVVHNVVLPECPMETNLCIANVGIILNFIGVVGLFSFIWQTHANDFTDIEAARRSLRNAALGAYVEKANWGGSQQPLRSVARRVSESESHGGSGGGGDQPGGIIRQAVLVTLKSAQEQGAQLMFANTTSNEHYTVDEDDELNLVEFERMLHSIGIVLTTGEWDN